MIVFRKRFGVAGKTEIVQLQMEDANGGYTPAVNLYDGSEELACTIWPGDDQAATTTLAASWNDAPNGVVNIPFDLTTMQTLEVTFYSGMLSLADGSADLAEFRLEVADGPGSGAAGATPYHTYRDLTNELPWVGQLADYLNDQSGFRETAQEARKWIDAAILKAAPDHDWSRMGGGLGNGGWRGDGYYGALGQAEDSTIAAALDADQLILTTATGHRFVKASIYHTISLILRRSIGMKSATDLYTMSKEYEDRAEKMLRSCTAEIDTNADGVAEYTIPLNRVKVVRA